MILYQQVLISKKYYNYTIYNKDNPIVIQLGFSESGGRK